jgi:hypothetical protein
MGLDRPPRSGIMEQRIVYLGLNLHMDTIAAAFAQACKRGELRSIARS